MDTPHSGGVAPGSAPRPGAEAARLREDAARTRNWKRWGPYLAERQWGTVREDYSADGSCWSYFPHDHARSRAYRWGEDGLFGITDRECRLCFALALWNEKDPILKERLFGLTGPEGNHGEDVKEEYFYLDSTPTHSFMKALYKYPHAAYPYQRLVEENARRSRDDPEFELADAGVFDESRYFDIVAEYAKADPNDLCIRIVVTNRGPEAATLHILPTLWLRNTWTWGGTGESHWPKGRIALAQPATLVADHPSLGRFRLAVGEAPSCGERKGFLFTENETNIERLFGAPNPQPYVKDAFHEHIVQAREGAVNPEQHGSKAAAHFVLRLRAGETATLRLRLASDEEMPAEPLGARFDATFRDRLAEADEFHASRLPRGLSESQRHVIRQADAGLLWSKQFFHFVVKEWLDGDPTQPAPPPERRRGRNADWPHLYNRDVVSMPDKWEYPWYAAWDLAFHAVALAKLDPDFAKEQLLLFLREWYMHPSGQIPAYEFAFGDVNPPVHAWACWRVYKMTGAKGQRDTLFLARAFHKLLLNFTWWVNRKDPDGRNIFAGGFLGLDNIGVFDRSQPLPGGARIEQADGTAWMAFYCLTMLSMALELAREKPEYEDVASKFFEHFIAICDAMNAIGKGGLWNERDGFYYDELRLDGKMITLRTRSMVGVIPLLAVEILENTDIARLEGFQKRTKWFLKYRADLAHHVSLMQADEHDRGQALALLAIPSRERLARALKYILSEDEFLSPFGVRSVSKVHKDKPYIFRFGAEQHRVDYVPGESNTALFGGNSNWRGPIWFPINYLLVEALQRYHRFYGESFTVECPTGSGRMMNLDGVANELARRLASIFEPDGAGRRPCFGTGHLADLHATDPAWRDLLLFHEYFHGDSGKGLGASHQTGWTALVAPLLEKSWGGHTSG